MSDPQLAPAIRHLTQVRTDLHTKLGMEVVKDNRRRSTSHATLRLVAEIESVEFVATLLQDRLKEYATSDLFWCGGYSESSLRLSADSRTVPRFQYTVTREAEGTPYFLTVVDRKWGGGFWVRDDEAEPVQLGEFGTCVQAQEAAQQHNDAAWKPIIGSDEG